MRDPEEAFMIIIGAIIGMYLIGVVIGRNSNHQQPVDPYCELVTIFIESDGEFGWPDYRKNYHTECQATPITALSTQGGGE